MSVIRKDFANPASLTAVGPRVVRSCIASQNVDAMGEQIIVANMDWSAFMRNPMALWNHDPGAPIGTWSNLRCEGSKIYGDLTFAPQGASRKADEIYALVKAGIVKSASVGFDPIECEPIDPSRPRGPQRYLRTSLVECSLVSLPANSDATIFDKARRANSTPYTPPTTKAERMARAAALARDPLDRVARAQMNPTNVVGYLQLETQANDLSDRAVRRKRADALRERRAGYD